MAANCSHVCMLTTLSITLEYKLTIRIAAARVIARSPVLRKVFKDMAILNGLPIVPVALQHIHVVLGNSHLEGFPDNS